MYANVQYEELLKAVETAYNAFDKSVYEISAPPNNELIALLKIILENNIFEFNSRIYKQIIGCAMGARCSPEVCDIRMYEVMNQIILKVNKDVIFYQGRYRDDGFIIYNGDESEIHTLFNIANAHYPLLKFTYEISSTEINFLDTTVYKGRRFAEHGILDIKSYIKPTNSFQYLERNSAHNPSVFKALIKGETIRHIRNTSDINIFTETIRTFKSHLIKRGYKSDEIDDISDEIVKQHNTRENILRVKSNVNKRDIPLVFVTKYNARIKKIKQITYMLEYHTK